MKKPPKKPEKVLTAAVTERRKKIPAIRLIEEIKKDLDVRHTLVPLHAAVVSWKHPGPEQVFRPHVCKAPWSVHSAYILLLILTAIAFFSWGYGPQWYQLAGDHVAAMGK